MELKTAITVLSIIVAVAFAMLIGDYLGYKFGRMKLATYTLFAVLGLIVLFAIYAAFKLLVLN
ncbi:MAG TPA: hypothetical protein VLH15_00570 [Dehalococcoidales bacterium]|nr:hypothetical protein [Dehalococcoidales bacterium]